LIGIGPEEPRHVMERKAEFAGRGERSFMSM
jgi:hypothetical protein